MHNVPKLATPEEELFAVAMNLAAAPSEILKPSAVGEATASSRIDRVLTARLPRSSHPSAPTGPFQRPRRSSAGEVFFQQIDEGQLGLSGVLGQTAVLLRDTVRHAVQCGLEGALEPRRRHLPR